MKIFIFEEVFELTERYHNGGGLLVIAQDKDHALELLTPYTNIRLSKEEWDEVITYNLAEPVDPKVFIFPDAGCC